MKRAMRWIVPVVGVAAVAVLFFVLRPSEDSSDGSVPTPTSAATAETSVPEPSATGAPAPDVTVLETTVENGEVDGPAEFEVPQGDRVEIVVHADVTDEVHVHGYDIHGDVSPSEPSSIRFTADAPGVYEVELESAGLLLFALKVTP